MKWFGRKAITSTPSLGKEGDKQLASVSQMMAKAQRLLFITGAGMSADSGLPTYRGIGGLYEDQATEDDVPIEVALSGDMLKINPQLTWKYLHQIESACRDASYNKGHEIIAQLQDRYEVCVLTQNIDGFHRDAGSKNVIEMHGNVHGLTCMGCGDKQTVPDYSALEMPPRCQKCDGMLRPEVVLFGEMLPGEALEHYYREINQGFDLVFSIGTTSVFPYISGPVVDSARKGVPTVEVNPGQSEVSGVVQERLRLKAADVLTRLWETI